MLSIFMTYSLCGLIFFMYKGISRGKLFTPCRLTIVTSWRFLGNLRSAMSFFRRLEGGELETALLLHPELWKPSVSIPQAEVEGRYLLGILILMKSSPYRNCYQQKVGSIILLASSALFLLSDWVLDLASGKTNWAVIYQCSHSLGLLYLTLTIH